MALGRLVFLALVSCILAEDPKIYFVEKFEGKLASNHCSKLSKFCQFRLFDLLLKQAYFLKFCYFQTKVGKIDGLNLLSRGAMLENSSGRLENFTTMLISIKVKVFCL